ncbi:hypothetical protein [Amycolatopsis alba]|uniref:hypothetical protein n=1 Tax=Amycolatopsis alba TaxID=76020 RepID=UPI00036D291E|nr:hypothetical protein [Amycolatopsis alba]
MRETPFEFAHESHTTVECLTEGHANVEFEPFVEVRSTRSLQRSTKSEGTFTGLGEKAADSEYEITRARVIVRRTWVDPVEQVELALDTVQKQPDPIEQPTPRGTSEVDVDRVRLTENSVQFHEDRAIARECPGEEPEAAVVVHDAPSAKFDRRRLILVAEFSQRSNAA